MLAALQAGNRGTQACITAASAVSGIIADLDTTIMFATAGTLNRENAETFADHRCLNWQKASWRAIRCWHGPPVPPHVLCYKRRHRLQTWQLY